MGVEVDDEVQRVVGIVIETGNEKLQDMGTENGTGKEKGIEKETEIEGIIESTVTMTVGGIEEVLVLVHRHLVDRVDFDSIVCLLRNETIPNNKIQFSNPLIY